MSFTGLLLYGGDWRAQAAGGVFLLAAFGFGLIRVLGLRNGLRILAAAGVVFIGLVYGRRERQRGWTDAREKGRRDAATAISKGQRARTDADRRNADARRLRDDDGHRRD